MKDFDIFGIHRKICVLEGDFTKNQSIGRNCLNRGDWIVCRFKWGLIRRRGGVFDRGGGVDTPMHTMVHFKCF